MKSTPSPAKLDAFDRKILAILQEDCTTSLRIIGDAVCLSAPAVQRRIRRLVDDRVIAANVAIVEPAALGPSVTVIVEVAVICESSDQIESVKQTFSARPEVQQCYYVTGEANFVLVVNVSSMADYEAFTRQMFFGRNSVKRFRSFVTMDRVKIGLSVPIHDNVDG